jgi:chromate transporter
VNIYLQLFLVFLEIGAVSFGGGYGMISLMREKTIGLNWLTDGEFLNIIAVSESTPGPIAVNIATFVGATQGGVIGALCATLGIILPSFIIILVISALIGNLMKFAGVQAVVNGMKPAVTGIIIATAIAMLIKALIAVEKIREPISISYDKILIFSIICAVAFGYKKIFKNKISPILLIIISACLGMLICPFLQ